MLGAERADVRGVADEAVRPAEAEDARRGAGLGERLEHGGAEAARDGAVLEGDDEARLAGLREQQPGVDRLGEAGVDQADRGAGGGGEGLRQRAAVGHHRAEGPDLDVAPLAQDLGLADGQDGGRLLDGDAGGGAARVADEHGRSRAEGGVEHVGELVLVLGLHDRGVGHAAQVGDVEEPVVRRAVLGREPGSVHAEGHRQALQADVVDDHVVGPLQEGRVDGADRPQAARGEAGGEERGVLLGDPDVVVLAGQLALELGEAGAGGHRGGDADDAGVGARLAHEKPAQNVLPGARGAGRAGGEAVARLGIEGAGAVELLGVAEGGGEAPALLGAHVQDDGDRRVLAEAQVALERLGVVAVDGADVTQAELLEERAVAGEQVLDLALQGATEVERAAAPAGAPEGALQAALGAVVRGADEDAAQHLGDGADVAVDGPLVVVEHDHQARGRGPGVVQRLEGHAAGEGGVADHGHHVARLAEPVARVGEADRGGERGAGVAGAEGVVRALVAVEEAAQAARLADAAEVLAAAAGEELVHVALVGDVEDELVARGLEDAVEGEGQLDHAEVGADVPAVAGRDLDEARADLGGELRQAVGGQAADVLRTADGGQQGHGQAASSPSPSASPPPPSSRIRSSAAPSFSSQDWRRRMPSS